MELLALPRVIVAITCVIMQWFSLTTSTGEDHCKFIYTRQPSRDLNCSPQENKILLVCEVQSSAAVVDSYTLLWYALLSRQDSPELLQDGGDFAISTLHYGNTTHSTISLPVITDEASSSPPQVFCQIQLTDHDNSLIERSQVFIFSGPSSLPPCTPTSLVDSTPKYVECDSHVILGKLVGGDDVTSMTSPPSDSLDLLGGQPEALYSIISVIVAFVAIILVLTMIIVLLYRRKCGRGITRTADGASGVISSYGGFTTSHPLPALSTEGSIIKSGGPPPSSSLSSSFQSYHLSDVPPPRPLKPQIKPTDRIHPHETYRIENGNGTEYGMETATISQQPGDHVRREMDTSYSNNSRDPSKLEDDDGAGGEGGGGGGGGLCSDKEASLVKSHKKERVKFTVLEHSSTGHGQYERSPSYQVSATVVPLATAPPPHKYRGDYERDSLYMRQLVARGRAPTMTHPMMTAEKHDVMSGKREEGVVRTDKYRGDYERAEDYAPPPLTRKLSDLGSKYSGNYERAPCYTEWLLSNNMVPPPHATLESTTRLPSRYCTPLTQADQPHPPCDTPSYIQQGQHCPPSDTPSCSNSSLDESHDHCSISNPLYSGNHSS